MWFCEGGVDRYLGECLPIISCEPVIIGRPSKQYPLRMVFMEINIENPRQVSVHPLPKT